MQKAIRWLLNRDRKYWECALDRIEKFPKRDIEAILRVSYNGLSINEQNIFLDIACFFKGENKDCVIEILNEFRDVVYCSVINLIDKCLLTISNENTLEMHHLLQEMGQAIVGEESINPENRSRLYDAEEIRDILMNKKGTEAIQSINLDLSKVTKMHLPYDAFMIMSNLRLLRIIGWNSQVHTFDQDIQFLSNKMPYSFWRAFQDFGWDPQMQIFGHDFNLLSKELRYLYWKAFPFKNFPSTFHAENLVSLSLPDGSFKQLWSGTQHLVNLRWVHLHSCKYLTEIPDLSNAKNVEKLNLQGCESLVKLHSSVQHLTNLQSLNLTFCRSLRYLPSRLDSMSLQYFDVIQSHNVETCPYIVSPVLEGFSLISTQIKELPFFLHHSKRLRYLDVSNMPTITKFPEVSTTVKRFCLTGTSVEEVPSPVQSLTMLHHLDLSYNKNLSRLPTTIWELKSLITLDLFHCTKLEALPEILHPMGKSLQHLDLFGCYNLKALPNNISYLKSLQHLGISNCKLIRFIPTLPQSLLFLYADSCESLETVSVRSNCKIKEMRFTNCYNLDGKSRRKIIDHARIQPENIDNCIIVLPGAEIPQWFTHRSVGSSLTVPLPSNSNHLLGLSSCIVLQNSPIHETKGFVDLKFKCYNEFNTGIIFEKHTSGAWLLDNVKSDHLLLGKFPNCFTRKEPLRTCSKALIELCLASHLNQLVKQFGLDFHFGEEYSNSDGEECSNSDGEECSNSTEEDCQKLMGEDAHSKGGCDNYCPIGVEISTRMRAADDEEEEKPPLTKKIKIQ